MFEAAAAGACLLTDAWEGLELFLEPESEVLVVRGGAEVADCIATLETADTRRIGDAARRRVLAQHTYEQRAADLDALLDARVTA
ncbi:MAG TPA: glycosyltransferase [Luteitalea sp.]|nr:glycosyltransferase [Luteitalea sp.]